MQVKVKIIKLLVGRICLSIGALTVGLFSASPAKSQSTPPESEPNPSTPTPDADAGSSSPAAPSEPSATPADSAAPSPAAAVEVLVRGEPTSGSRRQRSAEAVHVVELKRAQKESADLGEVLARTQGIAVRREGGLGSGLRFSLNGLYDDQIRFFLDGVPLDLAGYPNGIANVPVNLVERAEVYRGVVPIRFGADALGGAVNLVTSDKRRDQLAASYELGSFGTRRVSASGSHHDPESGLVVSADGWFDYAKNDYPIDVQVPDVLGRLYQARVRRFHDHYLAFGGSVEGGVVGRSWAKALLLRAFASNYDKDIQNNTVMSTPYGEPTAGGSVAGATLRYALQARSDLELSALASYARRWTTFHDEGSFVYDWFGRKILQRATPGEIGGTPHDQLTTQDAVLVRPSAEWTIARDHRLRASSTLAFTTRTAAERIRLDTTTHDPLASRRDLFTVTSGIEYELNAFRRGEGEEDAPLQNVVFVKDYVYSASSEGYQNNQYRPFDSSLHGLGVGDAFRYRVVPWLYAKASYEYATRLPRPDEVFGDGILVQPTLELEPEVSHNANVGPRVELRDSAIGQITADVNAFLRDSDRLIVLLGDERSFFFRNVYRARALGLENSLAWTSPKRWVALNGTATYQDVRNASSEGEFARFDGDRIPNRPWFFASWGGRMRYGGITGPADSFEVFYNGRYTHSFFRAWESQGAREYKQVIDAQIAHGVGFTWTLVRELARITWTFEIQNVTNARLYDLFGVQRPGRAYYFKITGEL